MSLPVSSHFRRRLFNLTPQPLILLLCLQCDFAMLLRMVEVKERERRLVKETNWEKGNKNDYGLTIMGWDLKDLIMM